jgi:hypothetical protein
LACPISHPHDKKYPFWFFTFFLKGLELPKHPNPCPNSCKFEFIQICAKFVSNKYFGSKIEKEKGEKTEKIEKGPRAPFWPSHRGSPWPVFPRAQTSKLSIYLLLLTGGTRW